MSSYAAGTAGLAARLYPACCMAGHNINEIGWPACCCLFVNIQAVALRDKVHQDRNAKGVTRLIMCDAAAAVHSEEPRLRAATTQQVSIIGARGQHCCIIRAFVSDYERASKQVSIPLLSDASFVGTAIDE